MYTVDLKCQYAAFHRYIRLHRQDPHRAVEPRDKPRELYCIMSTVRLVLNSLSGFLRFLGFLRKLHTIVIQFEWQGLSRHTSEM